MKRTKANHFLARMGALLALILVAALLAIPTSAESAEVQENATAQSGTADALPPAELPATAPPPTSDLPFADTQASEDGTSATVSRSIALFFSENVTELISGATLILGLTAALLLKKRVLPPILEALAGILGKSREAVDALAEGHAAERRELDAILGRSEAILAEAHAAAERAEAAAAVIGSAGSNAAQLRGILEEQSGLLYELLMSANLPQYQKDRIGKAHAEAARMLSESNHE